MNTQNKYMRISLFLIFLIIAEVTFGYTLWAGIKFFAEKARENADIIYNESEEKVYYAVQKLLDLTEGKKESDLRKDDEKILARQELFDAYHYDLSLSFDFVNKTIIGELFMTANCLSDTLNVIYLNLHQNMKVDNVSFVNKKDIKTQKSDVREYKELVDIPYKQENDYLIAEVGDNVKKNEEFIIKVKYSGTPKNLGFDSFSFKEVYGSIVVYNLSEPNYGPVWWPSKDLPNDKALSRLHLIVPKGFTGVSNGLLTETSENDNQTTFTWTNSYPISTYLVSIVVAKFAHWKDTYTSLDGTIEMPVDYYVFQKDSVKSLTDWKNTPEMIKCYAKLIGEYPFIKEKYGMAEFGWTSGAMEHQTLTSMGYLLLTGDGRYENIVAHELAHHWFGDAVTLATWKDIWLNEGFASYCEALWQEYKNGREAYFNTMRGFDYGFFSGTVYAPEGFINIPSVYATIYLKGAWVVHMLRGVLEDEIFFKAVREYYERYKYKNATTKDLQAVFEEISNRDLQWFFEQWIYTGKGRPKYEYSWKFEEFTGQTNSGAYTVHLSLKQVQTDWDVYKMPIRIKVVTETDSQDFTIFNDTREQSFILTVNSKPKEVKIDPEGWILKKLAKGKYNQ